MPESSLCGSARIRILLIDDHRSVSWGLERLIESEGNDMTVVGSATNGSDALRLLDSVTADVILLDLDLGQESGLDLIPLLSAKSKARILVLTGLRDQLVHDKAILAGAKGVIEKTACAESILNAITKVHAGEMWIDRGATNRILLELSRKESTSRDVCPEAQKMATLTDKERLVIVAITTQVGTTTKAISGSLFISESTLRNHLTSIYSKLGVASRLELFAYAGKHNLTAPKD